MQYILPLKHLAIQYTVPTEAVRCDMLGLPTIFFMFTKAFMYDIIILLSSCDNVKLSEESCLMRL